MAEHKPKLNRVNVGVKSDRFAMKCFDHMEFFTLDAKSAMKTLKLGIGMEIVGQSMHETGNHIFQSYVLKTGNIKWIVTAPYLSDFKHPKARHPFVLFLSMMGDVHARRVEPHLAC